jgi:hypothetical protein
MSRDLIAQCISNCQDEVAGEVVCCLTARIFDPVVAGAVPELPIFKFSILVLDNLIANLSANKIVQGLGRGGAAGKEDDRAIIVDGTLADRFLHAVTDSRQCQLLWGYLREALTNNEGEAECHSNSTNSKLTYMSFHVVTSCLWRPLRITKRKPI